MNHLWGITKEKPTVLPLVTVDFVRAWFKTATDFDLVEKSSISKKRHGSISILFVIAVTIMVAGEELVANKMSRIWKNMYRLANGLGEKKQNPDTKRAGVWIVLGVHGIVISITCNHVGILGVFLYWGILSVFHVVHYALIMRALIEYQKIIGRRRRRVAA